MTQPTESTGLLPNRDQGREDHSTPCTQSADQQIIRRRVASVRWRAMITAAIIVLDLFLLYASISLIGVFFPTEVSDKYPCKNDKEQPILTAEHDSEI